MPSHHIYAVRIQNDGTLGLFQHRRHHFPDTLTLAQSRANQDRIQFGQPLQNFPDGVTGKLSALIRQREHNGFVQLHSLDVVDAFGHTQKHQSAAAAQGTHSRKVSRAGISPAAAQQQDLTEIALMGSFLPIRQQVQNLFVIQFHDSISSTSASVTKPLDAPFTRILAAAKICARFRQSTG